MQSVLHVLKIGFRYINCVKIHLLLLKFIILKYFYQCPIDIALHDLSEIYFSSRLENWIWRIKNHDRYIVHNCNPTFLPFLLPLLLVRPFLAVFLVFLFLFLLFRFCDPSFFFPQSFFGFSHSSSALFTHVIAPFCHSNRILLVSFIYNILNEKWENENE